jgi:hypothetical protein
MAGGSELAEFVTYPELRGFGGEGDAFLAEFIVVLQKAEVPPVTKPGTKV